MKTVRAAARSRFVTAVLIAGVLASATSHAAGPAPATVIDSGDDPSAWTALSSPSATARVEGATGERGGAIALAFDLGRGRGHAIARRSVQVDLPPEYMLVFSLRSDAEPNTIEIKLISGENVWWKRLADVELARDYAQWKDLRVSKARIAFAWGPAGGGMPSHLDAIEIAVVSGKGGQGRLWIDEIRLEPREPAANGKPPAIETSTNAAQAPLLLDGNAATAWRSGAGARDVSIELDFHLPVEQGGLAIEHAPDGFSSAYVVEASLDRSEWTPVRRFERSNGGIDHVFLPDVYCRFLRLRFAVPAGREVAIAEIRPQPFEYSSSFNGFFTTIARSSPAGTFPRYFAGEQSYWTVAGAPGDADEALVSEEGAVEVAAGSFTLEPFVFRDGALRTWKDAETTVSLEDGDLPIPTVVRRDGDLSLAVTVFAAGREGASTLYVRYRLAASVRAVRGSLCVAIRPFQVLPPWQALNRTGGAAKVRRIERRGDAIVVDERRIEVLTSPSEFGAVRFEEGDIGEYLRAGDVPPATSVEDPFEHASAALAWDIAIEPGAARDVWLAVPYGPHSVPPTATDAQREELLARTRTEWRGRLDRVSIDLPAAAKEWQRSLHSNLAYILVNRDGHAIQPGSRTYERSWIRDGAMTSGALLELGFDREVKDFLRWYATFVGADGYVPCCVDARGADPVPEHDSFGEFIWAIAEVWRFTRDEAFVRELWPKAKTAAACMSRLRAKRMTAEYRSGERRDMYGLLPESISHEGYSARPVHSYWDQAFALRGYADAAMLARVAGDEAAAVSLAAERDAFAADLAASVRATMARHSLDVVPASVELGDFDPTSTAVSFLLGTDFVYPREALERSFDKYMADLRGRRGLGSPGVGYTAYELRSATALVLLGRRAEAIELLGTLVADERPPEWNQWPEISWLRTTEPSFLGDLPHTWIGSTFVHAVRTLLVAEGEGGRPGEEAAAFLLVGAGVPLEWLAGGEAVRARDLPTWFGPLSVEFHGGDVAHRAIVTLREGDAKRASRAFSMPARGLEVVPPFGAEVEHATVDGEAVSLEGGSVRIARLPATVVFQYKPRLEQHRGRQP